MKRIVILVCGLLLLVANTAEARRSRRSGPVYQQPMPMAPVAYNVRPVQQQFTATTAPAPAAVQTAKAVQPVKATTAARTTTAAQPVKTVTVGYRSPVVQPVVSPAKVVNAGFSTATAQGVANIMASRGHVGHFGGNPGYEGCGMGATPQAAYSICCYGNSGMATVDVGYAQGANGMWYCCRRYR